LKKNLPFIIILLSSVLLIREIIFLKEANTDFWLSISTSILLIIAMILLIRENKKQDKENL